MKIFIIRHGETLENDLGIVQGKGVDGILNDRGIRQSIAFFERYKDEGFEMIISSSLKRTIETIQPFIDLGIKWKKSPDLDEIGWGEHEGKKYNPIMIANYKKLIEQWKQGNLDAKIPGGESAHDLVLRVDSIIKSIMTHSFEKILICTHGRTIRCLLCRFLDLGLSEMEKFNHQNTGLFLLEGNGINFHLIKENDVSHLTDDLLLGNQHF